MRYATGIFSDHVTKPSLYNPVFADVLQQYNTRQPMTLPDFGCKGTCEFDVVAAGWDVQCTRWTSPFRLMSVSEYEE